MVVIRDGKWYGGYIVYIQDITRVYDNGFIYIELGVRVIMYFIVFVGVCKVV